MVVARSLLLASCVLAASCAGEGEDGEEIAGGEARAVVGTPDGRQIAGRLTRALPLTSAPGGGTTYCEVGAGVVTVAKYERGHYRIYLAGHRPCDASRPESYRGWVPADAIAIEDGAYLGKVKRVTDDPSIEVRMSYAGDAIFCTAGNCLIHEPLYGMNRCYLHPELEPRVRDAAARLQRRLPGARLTLRDCYRPVYVQYRMAELVADPVWVAQPSPPRYGGHNGGIAVDVSIVSADGTDLDMGSGFDEFSPRSHYAAPGIPAAARENRKVLRDAMVGAGLSPYNAEWWHFSLAIDVGPLDLAL